MTATPEPRVEQADPGRETISVIIASFTIARLEDLVRAVESVRAQSQPAVEIIVVIDADSQLARRVAARLDGEAVIANSHQPGLSGARQSGVEAAHGSILAFLDDDAVADRDWLAEMLHCYEDPNVLGVGGRIDPLWQQSPPAWFPAEFNWVIGCSYAGMPLDTAPIRNPIGANMSIRAAVLAAAGGFDARLGRVDGQRGLFGSGEDTELGIRTAASNPGRHWVYRPQARVRHVVTAERGTWRYFVKRCAVEGRAKALLANLTGPAQALRTERSYARSVLPKAVARELANALLGRPEGLARAAAIVVGLGVTTLAYARTRIGSAFGGSTAR